MAFSLWLFVATECFAKLHPFWIESMNFSIDLLSKLVLDMYRLTDNKAPNKSGTVAKVPSELFCFLGYSILALSLFHFTFCILIQPITELFLIIVKMYFGDFESDWSRYRFDC
jgi:hypothetical protein